MTSSACSTRETIELAIDSSPPAASSGFTGTVAPTGGREWNQGVGLSNPAGNSELNDLSIS